MKREWLIRIRKYKNLTQVEVAKRAFINRSYYTQIENGKRSPSPSVALNIAKALDFDPIFFYNESLHERKNNQQNSVLENKIFEQTLDGKVLYLYNQKSTYLEHATTILSSEIKKGSLCVVLDFKDQLMQVKQNLSPFKVSQGNIQFIEREQSKKKASLLLKKIHFQIGEPSICIWLNEIHIEKDKLRVGIDKYIKSFKEKSPDSKVLLINALDANHISAASNIILMREHPYMMTDYEIIDSPLYQAGKTIYPSLYKQRETIKDSEFPIPTK